MQLTDTKENKNGRILKTPQNCIAFVPNDLPSNYVSDSV